MIESILNLLGANSDCQFTAWGSKPTTLIAREDTAPRVILTEQVKSTFLSALSASIYQLESTDEFLYLGHYSRPSEKVLRCLIWEDEVPETAADLIGLAATSALYSSLRMDDPQDLNRCVNLLHLHIALSVVDLTHFRSIPFDYRHSPKPIELNNSNFKRVVEDLMLDIGTSRGDETWHAYLLTDWLHQASIGGQHEQ